MFELLIVFVFIWLSIKAVGLVFRLSWGIAKIAAGILITLAFPALILCMVFAGGIALLIPIAMIGAAAGVVKACL